MNEVITYSLATDSRGRPCAANATLAGDKLIRKAPKKGNTIAIYFSIVSLVMIGLSVAINNLPFMVLFGYVSLSLITFIAYALDKLAAKQGTWRTGEGTLLVLGLVGGWPGALIAQETLRHKSSKRSFRSVFWVTVLMNCTFLAWLHTDNGSVAMQSLLS